MVHRHKNRLINAKYTWKCLVLLDINLDVYYWQIEDAGSYECRAENTIYVCDDSEGDTQNSSTTTDVRVQCKCYNSFNVVKMFLKVPRL